MNLADSLRKGAFGHLLEIVRGEEDAVTCPRADTLAERPQHPDYCGEIYDGHRCRYVAYEKGALGNRGTHRGYRHGCGCEFRWHDDG